MFLYDPAAHQWSQSFLDSKTPSHENPMIGSFQDGQGVLISEDTEDDKAILARGTWSGISKDAHHFQIDYSNDGGGTWHPAFIADLTRETRDRPIVATNMGEPGQHDFDFDLGKWKTHSSRLLHPLTGSTQWADMDGATVVKPSGAAGQPGRVQGRRLRRHSRTALTPLVQPRHA